MDKIVGLGSAGCAIVVEFQKYPQYTGYQIDTNLQGLKKNGIYCVEAQRTSEEYEDKCPSVKNFLKSARPDLMFVLSGSGLISGATLALLEQIRDRNIHVLYVKSGERRLSERARLTERATFGILQEYARSGLLSSFRVVGNKTMEQILGQTPVIGYYQALNNLLVRTIHMINVFDNTAPVVADFSPISEINRIGTYGFSVFGEKNEEKLFFPLDNIRQKRYYFAINEKQLEEDVEINNKIDRYLNSSEEQEIDISYGIYPTKYDVNHVYYKVYTNAIQEHK